MDRMARDAIGRQTGYSVAVTLPSGLWLEGDYHRLGRLRALAGSDEAFLIEHGNAMTLAQRTTALLARCLVRLGQVDLGASDDPEALVRLFTVGDREALLLHLRRLAFGDRLQTVLQCPKPDCGRLMDLELQVSDLLLPPYATVKAQHQAVFEDGPVRWEVCFRLPTGADQEAAAMLDAVAGGDLIVGHCALEVQQLADGLPTVEGLDGLPAVVRRELPALMASLDPQAEILLDVACPECGTPFTALFDSGAFLLQEIAQRSASLYHEVHALAYYYHWSEAEIMAMSTTRRQRYIELLADAMTG